MAGLWSTSAPPPRGPLALTYTSTRTYKRTHIQAHAHKRTRMQSIERPELVVGPLLPHRAAMEALVPGMHPPSGDPFGLCAVAAAFLSPSCPPNLAFV